MHPVSFSRATSFPKWFYRLCPITCPPAVSDSLPALMLAIFGNVVVIFLPPAATISHMYDKLLQATFFIQMERCRETPQHLHFFCCHCTSHVVQGLKLGKCAWQSRNLGTLVRISPVLVIFKTDLFVLLLS